MKEEKVKEEKVKEENVKEENVKEEEEASPVEEGPPFFWRWKGVSLERKSRLWMRVLILSPLLA